MTEAALRSTAAAFRAVVEPLDDVWITVHESPDGDSIGAALALQRVLAGLGKRAVAIRQHPFPRHYESLPGAAAMGDVNDLGRLFRPRVVVAVDVGSFDRVGAINQHIGPHTTVINIDHHHGSECPPHAGRKLDLVDPDYPSTTALVYALCSTAWPGCIDAAAASCLYVGLITDTGCFRFSNTNERTLRIGSELAGLGADPGHLSEAYMFRRRPEALRLLGDVLGTLRFHSGVRLATLVLTHAMLQRTGGRMDETEGFVNYATSLDGVEVAAFLREVSAGSTRISLRSSHDFDVSVVARGFGGGGHRKAAGLSVPKGVDDARTVIVDAILDHLPAAAPEAT
jgi:phosphoesterase RecJ-like protein